MERKRWTPKTEITESLLKFREKRRWQLALRRYVVEKKACPDYALYFGLAITKFREWIENQFTEGLTWETFGVAWQFYHIIPVGYFDFSRVEELKTCWNFVNIRVEKIKDRDSFDEQRIDIITARGYFEDLYKKTRYTPCLWMIKKITSIEELQNVQETFTEQFIISNKDLIQKASTLSQDEFNSLNTGMSLEDILLERDILNKFG